MDSLQLNHPIHTPSVLKIVDKHRVVKTVYVEKQAFKRVENYFTSAILFQEELEDGNEADSELDNDSDKASAKMDPLVIGTSNVNKNPK